MKSAVNHNFIVNKSVHSYDTRQSNDLHIHYIKKSIGQRTVQHIGSVLWNFVDQNELLLLLLLLLLLPFVYKSHQVWHGDPTVGGGLSYCTRVLYCSSVSSTY